MANNDRVYEAYSGGLGESFQQTTRCRIDWIINKADKAQKVLDIGCSQGIVSLLLAEKGKDVTGVDIQKESIDFANDLLKQKYSAIQGHVQFICADIMDLPPVDKFDCIVITEVIEHLNNPGEILQKAGTMLKPDGIMIVSTPFGVCLHPDHKATYYVSNFIDLLSKSLAIKSIEFVETWMGAVCTLSNGSSTLSPYPYFTIEESEFERREHRYLDRIEALQNNFQSANDKYKDALKNHATLKQWLTAKDEKLKASKCRNEELAQQLNEINAKYKEALINYETAKGWVSARNDKLQEAENMVSDLQEKLNQSQSKNQNMQRSLAQIENKAHELTQSLEQTENIILDLRQKLNQTEQNLEDCEQAYQLLLQQNKTIINHNQSTERELSDCLKDYDLIIMNTEQLMSKITRLEVQSSALVQKNNELQEKIDIIDNNKIGRLGIKLYHLYKRICNR